MPSSVIGLILNILFPSLFSLGGPSTVLKMMSMLLVIPEAITWIWLIVLILTQVPQKQLVASRKFQRLIPTAVAQPSLPQPQRSNASWCSRWPRPTINMSIRTWI